MEQLHGQLEDAGLSELAPPLYRKPGASTAGPGEGNVHISHAAFTFAERVILARRALAAPTDEALTLSLEHFGQYAGNETAPNAEIAELFSLLAPDGQLTPHEATMQTMVGDFVSASTSASTENQHRQAADMGWETASYILTGSETAISEVELKSLFQWVHGNSMHDLGFKTRERYRDQHQNVRYRELGEYGNFGKEKYEFAKAWLSSSREERLSYFGLPETSLARWENAAPIIGQSIAADAQARAIERAEFGLGDVILLGISIAAGFVVPGAIAGLAPAFFSTTVGLGLQAGIGGFSSTLISTKGDLDAALEAGGMALISGGLGEYVSNLEGYTGTIARSILNGAINELSGQDFIDGVMSSLGSEVGNAVRLRIGDNMPAFVNDFTGKTIELSIRHRGDVDLITAGLENFVKNYAVDNVDTFLTDVVGIENDLFREPLAQAFTEFVNSNGDFNAALDKLQGSVIDQVTDGLGQEALDRLGGAEALHSQVFYGLAAILIEADGDISGFADQADNFALSLLGDWAGTQLTQGLDAALGTENNPFAAALGELTRTAVATGWEGGELSISAFGPLADALGDVLPLDADGAAGFLARSLDALTQSYIDNNGDMQAVAQDMTTLVVDEMILAEQSQTELQLGDTGPRVTAMQQQLQEQGFFHASVDGVYDQDTLAAVNRFQDDALSALQSEELLAEQAGDSDRAGQLRDTWTQLHTERINQVFDEASALLLATPAAELFQSTFSPELDQIIAEGIAGLTLRPGDTGSEVIQLQEALQQAGFSSGAVDGIFGPDTASALNAFQEQQIGYLDEILSRTGAIDSPQRQQLVEEWNQLLSEQQEGVAASGSWQKLGEPLDLEAVAQMTTSLLDAGSSPSSVEDTLTYISSVLDRQPGETAQNPFVLAATVPLRGTSWTDSQVMDIFQKINTHDSVDQNKIIENLFDNQKMDDLIELLEGADAQVRQDMLNGVAKHLSGERLHNFYYGASDQMRQEIIQAANLHGSEATQIALVDLAQRDALGLSLSSEARGLSHADKELLLDIGQISLDLIGIFEPTPFADGTNAVISILRGNLIDAGISAVSMIPYIGDLAKAGKLGSWAATVEAIVSRYGGRSAEYIASTPMGRVVIPALERISNQIDIAQNAAGGAIWRALGEETQQTLVGLKRKIDDLITGADGSIPLRPSRVASNTDNLADAGWDQARITRELGIRNAQIIIVDDVDNWVIEHNSTVDEYFRQLYTRDGVYDSGAANNAKGNYGEMKADLEMTETHGYIPVGANGDRLTSLDQDWGKQGIDGIYQRPDGSYVVTEVKPNGTGTAGTGLGQQLSDDWLKHHLESMFADNQNLIDDIIDDASRVLINYESIRAGDLSLNLVNNEGIRTNSRFNP